MPGGNIRIEPTLQALGRAQFGIVDILRRAHGDALAAFGLGPREAPYRIVASGPHWRLRDYGGRDASPSLLIIAAPIKRPYIWDLTPAASAIRLCLREGLHVHLLEWLPATPDICSIGLDECALAVSSCVTRLSTGGPATKPFLIGHSLGGTLAAIYAAWAPDSIRGVVLLGAPLCFEPETSRFRDALVALLPSTLSETEPFPGALLSHMSALASPDTFVWNRLIDAALSSSDHDAVEIHARIERWALEEVALPGKVIRQVVEELYRENRFFRGTLKVHDALIGPSMMSVPTLAAVNVADEVVPVAAVAPFLDALPCASRRLIRYRGEVGVCLQHLAILVGCQARAQVWPEIFSWMRSQA
jgi:polyhydroxyalkanoate synthase subunit PhaC